MTQLTLFDSDEPPKPAPKFKRLPPVEEMFTPAELARIERINSKLEKQHTKEMGHETGTRDRTGTNRRTPKRKR